MIIYTCVSFCFSEAVLLVTLFHTVYGLQTGEYGYFNHTSQVTIPGVTLTLGQGSWIQVLFRTCAPSGEVLKYHKNGDQLLSVSLHNTSLQLRWSINNTNGVMSLGSKLNNNTWFQFDIKFFLGVVYLNVSRPGRTVLFSDVVANTTFQAWLLDVRLADVTLQLGRGFTGCLWQGPGVAFSSPGVTATNVRWNQCPLTSQRGCSLGELNVFSVRCFSKYPHGMKVFLSNARSLAFWF